MRTYTNDSILKIKSFKRGVEIISLTDIGGDYFEMREASPIVPHNNQLHWLTTCVRKVKKYDSNGKELYPGEPNKNGFVDEHSLHRFLCPDTSKPEKWDYKGRIMLRGQDGEIQGEDPTFYIASIGEIHLMCENKSYEKSHRMFTVGKFIAKDWNSDFMFQGGSTGLAPGGSTYYMDAMYSPEYTDKPTDPLIFDGRTGLHKEEIGIADWKNDRWELSSKPIFSVDDISQPIKSEPDSKVLTTGIGETFFEVISSSGKITYIMEIVAFKDWSEKVWKEAQPDVYNGYWCQGLAVSDSLRSGWKELDSEIKDQDGKNTLFTLFYSNGWKAILGSIDVPNKMYLAEAIIDNSVSPIVVKGCMDKNALNYNSNATEDDGSCKYAPTNGGDMIPVNLEFDKDTHVLSCDNIPEASRFDAYATGGWQLDLISSAFERLDGRIVFRQIQDKFILSPDKKQEFWIIAVINGKPEKSEVLKPYEDAITEVLGCTNPNALNYNPEATKDDGSCIFAQPGDNKKKLQDGIALIEQGLVKVKEVEADL